MERVKIDNSYISEETDPYIIAEIGSNHNGDIDLCKKIVDKAILAGANAVKFQSWTPNSLISRGEYERNTKYNDQKKHFGSLEEMVKRYSFTEKNHQEINLYCRNAGITFLSSAFSPKEINFLEELNIPAHKVASMDINHFSLLEALAATKKPILLSTGMASLSEIDEAVELLEKKQSGPIILLHCISIYPPKYEEINLNNIKMLQSAFGKIVGFSDHSIGTSIPLAAIALGAKVIEKHFTIDKNLEGWDHEISADFNELKHIVQEGRNVFRSLGSYRRIVSADEMAKRQKFRRRVVVKNNKIAGSRLELSDLDFKRPGNGISPSEYKYLLGRVLKREVKADHELEWDDLVS